MTERPETRRIADMFVNCYFPMRPDVMAASDTCQHPASSAVVAPDGSRYWRCAEHEGMVDATTRGETFYEVPVPPERGQ
jgi:hypothetical protein